MHALIPRLRVQVLIGLALAVLTAVPAGVVRAQTASEDAESLVVGMVLPAPVDDADAFTRAVRDAAVEGATLASDELGMNASILGLALEVATAEASDAKEAEAAADRLFADGAVAVAGGWGPGAAAALARSAERHDAAFLNLGAPDHRLRNELCSPAAFHVVPSAGMYLDALAGWFVREGFRSWFVVTGSDGESEAQLARLRRTLDERHFGARIVGTTSVDDANDGIEGAAATAAREDPDLILVLTDAETQLAFLEALAETGATSTVTGFPWPETETRTYYRAWGEAAAAAGSLPLRASAWEATLDAYGARELNARYEGRFGRPMDAPAWAAYQGVKLVVESIAFGGARGRDGLRGHLASEAAVFDVWKGIGVSFRPWNHQLRQSVFLIEAVPDASDPRDLALLVGELPAIYMPQTDPIERLDQLGDLERGTTCAF